MWTRNCIRESEYCRTGRSNGSDIQHIKRVQSEGPVRGAAGILVALPCAFLLKRFQGAPDQDAPRQKDLAFSGTVYEIALVVMSAYMAYLTAEVHHQTVQ